MELIEAAHLLRFNLANGWPETFSTEQAAALQSWRKDMEKTAWNKEASNWRTLIGIALQAGELEHTTTTTRVQVRAAQHVPVSEFGGWPDQYTRGGVRYAYTSPAQFKDVTHHHITAPAFAAWLAAQGIEPSPHIAAWFKVQGVAPAVQVAPEMLPVSNEAMTAPRRILKQKALVAEMEHKWPAIESDLSEASRNGLSAAAKVDGGWDVEAAEAWAKCRGKLKEPAAVHQLAAPWSGTVTKHRIQG